MRRSASTCCSPSRTGRGSRRAYKERLPAADRTIPTELFGLGWRAAHRVVPNEATYRHLGAVGRLPRSNRLVNRMASVGARHIPEAVQRALVARQRPALAGMKTGAPHSPTYTSRIAWWLVSPK